MSWNVLVLNYHGKPPVDIGQLPKDHRPDSLGPTAEVRKAISRVLPDVDWSNPTWGTYEGDGFVFEFNMSEEPVKDTFMIRVTGGGDAITPMVKLAIQNKWSLLDISTMEFIDPANPSKEGWEGFQKYRNNVIK